MGNASAVYIEYVTIPQYSTFTFETTSLSSGADTVMHLLRDNGTGGFVQVAVNDDYYGLASRISYYNGAATTDFVLLVRAYDLNSSGTCDVLVNSVLHQIAGPVGGWLQTSSYVTFSQGDQIRTMHLPGGSVAPMVATMTDRFTISDMALNNAAGGTSLLYAGGYEQYFLIGTPYVRDGEEYTTFRSGGAVLLANDIATDSDGDGLGDALEFDLGTCATVSGCPNTPHGMDTDRDGLGDGEEVLGVAGTLPDGSDDLAFARYGASPRKKDIFLEVDYLTDFDEGIQPGENPFQWIRNNPTLPIGSWTGTLESWIDTARAPFLDAPNLHVHNPDGTDGIELHLDIGVPPLTPYNEHKFGKWSSGSTAALVPDFISVYKGTINGEVTVAINDVPRTFDATGLTPEEIALNVAINALLTDEPVAFVSLTTASDGTATLVMESDVPGLHFLRDLFVPEGYESSIKRPREDNNSFRGHYDNDINQVDAVRRGRFRYAVLTRLSGDGQADGAKYVSSLNHFTFVHELGHTLGLQHFGHADWGNPGTNCIPHYQSVMRYADQMLQFSSSDLALILHPAATPETNSFGGPFDQSRMSVRPWNYSGVSANTTDWNRDGIISNGAVGWRGTALLAENAGCNLFSMKRVMIEQTSSISGPVDLTRLGSRLYAVWSTGDHIYYRFASLGSAGNKSCTGPADPMQGECLTWSARYSTGSYSSCHAVSVYSYSNYLFIAYRTSSGALRVKRYAASSTGTLDFVDSFYPGDGSGAQLSDHGPELVVRYQSVTSRALGLMYLARDGYFRSFGWNGSSWYYEGALLDANGNPIPGAQGPVAKAWPDDAVSGWYASEKRTVAILPSVSKKMRFYVLNYGLNRWQWTTFGDAQETNGKPFLEYRTVRDTTGVPSADFKGHFMIGHLAHNSDYGNRAKVVFSTLVSRSTPPGSTGFYIQYVPDSSPRLVGDYFQDAWATVRSGSSPSIYSDSTIDNVFAVTPLSVSSETEGLYFYPHADGSPDTSFTVHSDFRVMEDYICRKIGLVRGFLCGDINVMD